MPELDEFGIPKKTTTPVDEFGIPLKKKDGGLNGTTPSNPSSQSVSPSPSVGSFGFDDIKKLVNEGLRPRQDNTVMPASVKKSVAKFEQDQAQAEAEKTTQMVVKKLGIDKQLEAKNKIKEEEKAKVQKAADDLYETPLGKFYYQVINPLATAGGKGLTNTLTGTTRLIGTITNNEDVANKLADHINETLNPQYRWDNTLAGTQPKKLQGNLFNDGKVNSSKIVPSTVETLTNMAFLLGGTKGLGGNSGALVASSYINSLQGYRDEGAKAGLKGDSLDSFANISAMLEGTLELVSPNDIALGNFRSKIAKSYAKEIAKGVTVRQATKSAAKEFVKELGKENIQELTQSAKDKVIRLITDKVSDKPVFNDDLSYNGLKDEVLETVLLTSISTGLISAPNSIASAKPSTYEKSVWYTAAKNPDQLMNGLNKELEKGNISQEQFATAKNNFAKYQSALNQVEKLGYSEDQAVKMAWSVFKGDAINKNNKAIKENPVLNSSIGNEVKKQEQEVAQDIKLAGLGVPDVGSEINGTELSNVIMNTGDKGGMPSTQMIDGIKDNVYRVEEIDVKELYNNNPEFKKYVDEYQKKNQDADGLLIPAIVDGSNGIVDGRSRLASQYLAGQDKVKVFKQLNEKTGPEVSKIDSDKVENIKNKFDFIKDQDFVEESFTPEEDKQFRDSLPDSGIANEQELTDLLSKGEYAMLTGQNPDAVAVSKEANAKLNEKAQGWLAERGLKAIPIFGRYGNSERSFLVPGMTKQQAVEFANEFQQDSVAHSSGLVYKDGSYNPRTEGVNLEDRFDNGGDYFSTVNVGGKKVDFSVNYDFNKKISPDKTIADELLRDVFGQTQDVENAIENVRKALESTGVKVEVVPDETAFEDQVGGQRGLDGVFIAEDGKILLNEKRLKESAEAGRIIFHEGAHPVMNIIRNTNRELYNQVVAGLKEAAKTNPEIAASLQWAQENYDIEDVQNDEAVIETIAKVGDGTLDIAALPTGFKQKLIDLINLISKALGFGQIVNDTDIAAFKKIAADVANALSTGSDVADIVGKENVDQYQNEIPSTLAAGELSPDPQARVSEKGIDVYESKETEKLPVRSIRELFEKFKGRAVAINSDPTRVGELTLPSGKKIFMYGGPAYLSLKDNVQAGIGFATTQLSKVKTWAGYLNKVFGNERGLTIVTTQAPTSMMANSYALRYVLDAISTLPKSVLKSKEFKDEFFGKDLVLLKDAFGEKGYNDFVNKYKKADLSDAAVIDGMIAEMAYKVGDDNKPASFKARGAFVSNLLGGIALKSEIKGVEGDKGYVSKKPTKFIAKQLFDRLGLNQEKLFYELGEKSLVDLYMNEGKWGMAVAGFETEPGFSIEDTQAGGVKHPLFNAKFPGTDAFLLDGAYEVDKLFAPQSIISSNGNPYTKSAAQMLAGSMYVMGEETQGEKSFQYSPADASAPRIQARKSGNLIEQAKLDKKMAQDGNGNYVFYHYSAKKFSKVDPNKFGSNTSATGRDERPGLGISMFYTRPTDRESMVSGDNGYIVRVPMDKVYPFNADPLNFYDEAKDRFEKLYPGQAFEPNKQVAFITQVANDNGFPMTVAKWNGRLRAQTTESLKVEPLTEEAKKYKAQARKSALEQSTDFKLAAFVMRKKAEGATNDQIAVGIKSVMPSMDAQAIKDLVENPEGYINKKFAYLSEDLRSNLIGRAKAQNIYKANPKTAGAFKGAEVDMNEVKKSLQNNKKEQFKKAVQDWGKKWLTASKGLPDWVLAIKDKANGEKNFEVDRAARILVQLKNAAKKIGFSDWDAFSKAMVAMADQPVRQMSNSTDIAMYDPSRAAAAGPALQDNELPAIVPEEVKALPAEIVPFVYQMRGTIDRLTKDLVTSGYVTPEQAAVLEKNVGQYVNRAYKLFNEKGYKPSEDVLADAVKFIADQKYAALLEQNYNANAPKGQPSGSKTVGQFGGNTGGVANIDYDALMKQAIEEAKKDVNAILDRKTNPYFNAKTESRNTGILQEKKNIPEPIRKLMGEYTDPGTVFMMTVGKQAALKASTELLTTMREKGMGTLFFEENDPNRPVSHSVKIASDTGETKAPLNGLYTTPQIAEALESMEPTYNSLTQAWMKMVGAVRWGKTVGSVVTQFKNFESNLGFAVMNGMMFSGKNGESFKGAAKYIKGQYSKGEVDALTEKVMKLGLVGQSVGARELADMLQSGDIHDIALDMALNPKSKFNKVKDAAGMPFEQANKLYRLGDDFWKVYAYLNERQQLGNALFGESYDNLTPQQQEDVDTEASERVKSTWPTYDRIFEAAKYISKRAPIFGNFISFQAESLRVLANTIKLANKDMSSSNPDIQALGLRRMFGVTSYLGFRAAAVYAVAKAAGIAGAGILAQIGGDDEEKKKKRGLNKAMPPFMRTGDILPIQNKKEPWRYTVYNMSSIDPYGTIPNALNAATEGREGVFGKTMEPGVLAGLVEFFSGFMEPEMTFETTWSVINNANIKTGDPIVLPTDNDGEAAAKVSKYLFDQLKPSTIDMIERLYERDNKSAELSAMAGARPYDVDLHKSFRYGLSDMMKQLEDINKLYNRVNYSTTATEDQKKAAEQDAETSKARLIQHMHETYQDFITLGADPKVLDDMITKTRGIKSTGFDLQTKKAIKSGNFDATKLYKIKK